MLRGGQAQHEGKAYIYIVYVYILILFIILLYIKKSIRERESI